MPAHLITTDVGLALERLRAGGLVAIPTETVYGLAADAEQPEAVRRIYEVKGRPGDHPLIVHLASLEAVTDGWVASIPEAGIDLGRACWPGPLTMLLPRGPRASDLVTGGRETVGVRVPSHRLTSELLERFDGGLAAPSANPFGRVSPTSAAHVADDLADRLDPSRDAILDGGPCPVGVESTIVDLTVQPPQVLRAGAIDTEQIERLLAADLAPPAGPSRASGMLVAHYAPTCRVLLAGDADDAVALAARQRADGLRVEILDRTHDLVMAAEMLYADLRAADRAGLDALVVVVPPPVGLGHALRDRLTKAAAGSRAPTSRDD